MRSSTMRLAVGLAVAAAATQAMAQVRPGTRQQAPAVQTRTAANPARAGDDNAIRQLAAAYVKAYNEHQAKAIANLFAPDGQIVDEAGHAIQGRAEIERVFAELFQSYPRAHTTVDIKSVRFLGANLAVENGTARVSLSPDAPSEPNDYTVTHVKQDGKWLMASANDLPSADAPAEQQLQQLAWLIGEWVDESPESLIVTNYRWDENKNFILSDFTVQVAGKPVMNGTQRIGWDPLAGVLRSWVFDSEGGFAEGTYARDGDRWIIKMTGVTRDGKPASSTNVIARAGRDRLTWESRDRLVGGEPAPDTGQVTAVRKPPKPM